MAVSILHGAGVVVVSTSRPCCRTTNAVCGVVLQHRRSNGHSRMGFSGNRLSSSPSFGNFYALKTAARDPHGLPLRRCPVPSACASREGGPWTPHAHRIAVQLRWQHVVLPWSFGGRARTSAVLLRLISWTLRSLSHQMVIACPSAS